MGKLFKRTFVFILMLSIVLCYVPANSFVSAVENSESNASQNTSPQTEVFEVIGLREENIKHFDTGVGTFQAVVFGGPVHTLDADGHWQDIDNTLVLAAVDGDEKYSNQRVSFAPSLSVGQTVLNVNENGYAISMGLLAGSHPASYISDVEPVTAVVSNTPKPRSIQAATTVEELIEMRSTSTVLYENILPNTDLEYILTYKDIKENIIVKAPADNYCYSFALDLEGLDAQLQEDGSVSITDSTSGEEQYIIPSPYMYDANGNISDAVYYELAYANDQYYLSVTADAHWINAAERNFPVTVDPSINTTSSVYDSYISSAENNRTEPQGSKTTLWVSSAAKNSRHGDSIIFVMIPNLPSLPTGSTVTGTFLNMAYAYNPVDTTTGQVTFGAYRIEQPWTESGVTWNSRTIYNNLGISSSCLGEATAYAGTAIPSAPEWISISLGNLGQTWYNGYYNYGVALRYLDGPNKSVMFASRETSCCRPYLTINYEANTDYYEFTNYFDSTMLEHTNFLSYINSAVGIVNAAYSRQFGLHFGITGVPSSKSTLTDMCSLDANTPCSNVCSVHHKDVYWISNQLNNESREERELTVFWTDHESGTYCNHFYGTCNPENAYAMVIAHRPVIHIMNLVSDNNTSEEYKAVAGILLLHETAHALGLDENYDRPEHAGDGYQCVMERLDGANNTVRFYNSISNGTPAFCEGCKFDLLAALI